MSRQLVSVILAVSVAMNVWLARQVGEQALRLSAMVARPALAAGDALPDVTLLDQAGGRVRVSYGAAGMPTILYLLSPTCGWCNKNVEAVEELVRQTSGRYRAIGIALGDEAQLAKYPVKYSFPVYHGLGDADARAYKVRSTPATIVVSPAGVVTHIWNGAFVGDTKSNVETTLAVRLPVVDTSDPNPKKSR